MSHTLDTPVTWK